MNPYDVVIGFWLSIILAGAIQILSWAVLDLVSTLSAERERKQRKDFNSQLKIELTKQKEKRLQSSQ